MGIGRDLLKGPAGVTDYRASVPGAKSYGYATPEAMAGERFDEKSANWEARADQRGDLKLLRQRAQGLGGPSVAELQMQRGLGAINRATAQRAAGARGMSRALAQTNMQNAQGEAAAQNVANTGLLRAQEQIAAQELLQRGTGQVRGQDLTARGQGIEEATALNQAQQQAYATNAGVAQGNATRGQQATMGLLGSVAGAFMGSDVKHKDIYSRGMPSDFSLKEQTPVVGAPAQGATPVTDVGGQMPMYLNVPRAPEPQQVDEAQQMLDDSKRQRELQQGLQLGPSAGQGLQQSFDQGKQIGGGIVGGLAGLMSSDFNGKEITIRDSKRDLDSVIPTGYQYKPEASARMAGEQVQQAAAQGASPQGLQAVHDQVYNDKRAPREGIVAQDLQRSPAFKDAVVQGEAGLAVDRDRALSEALAQLGGLDKRLKAIESPEQRSPEIQQDFQELEAMLKAREPKQRFALKASAPASGGSAIEEFARRRMQASSSPSGGNDDSPKLQLVRDPASGEDVVTIDEGMRSDYYSKDYAREPAMPSDYTLKEPLRRGIPDVKLAVMRARMSATPQKSDEQTPRRAVKEGVPEDVAVFIGEEFRKRGSKGRTDDPANRRNTIRDAGRYLDKTSDVPGKPGYYHAPDQVLDLLNNEVSGKPRKHKRPFTLREVEAEMRERSSM